MVDPPGDVLADVLSLGLLRNATYKQIEARAPWGMSVRSRKRAVFYLVVRGRARFEADGEPPRILDPGNMVFLPCGDAHVLRDSPSTVPTEVCGGARGASSTTRRIGGRGAPTSILAAFFDLEHASPPLLQRRSACVVLSDEDVASDPAMHATAQLVLAELENPGPASAVILQRLADVLVVRAFRSLMKHSACREHHSQTALGALSDPPLYEALGLMHAHVAHPWTVAELASKVGLSRSGFAARFTALVGEPPLQYLARWRVARAAELLRTTAEGVGEIAQSVGYESTPSFNKAFKRWQGTSPVAYRRSAATPTPAGH